MTSEAIDLTKAIRFHRRDPRASDPRCGTYAFEPGDMTRYVITIAEVPDHLVLALRAAFWMAHGALLITVTFDGQCVEGVILSNEIEYGPFQMHHWPEESTVRPATRRAVLALLNHVSGVPFEKNIPAHTREGV